MTSNFDPYHKWLGIPPSDQPPNYYRLLGIELYEADRDVIDSAADQRMSFLRTFQTGKHGSESQRLLNEVSKARICLTNVSKKIEYDQQLSKEIEAQNEQNVVVAEPYLDKQTEVAPPPVVPRINPRTLRKRRFWISTALGIFSVLILSGIVYAVTFLPGILKGDPDEVSEVDPEPEITNPKPKSTALVKKTDPGTMGNPDVKSPDKNTSDAEKQNPVTPKPDSNSTDSNDPKSNDLDPKPNTSPETTIVELPTPPVPDSGTGVKLEIDEPSIVDSDPEPVDKRTPVPSGIDQDEAFAKMNELYKIDAAKTTKQQVELSRKLVVEVGQQEDPNLRYVMLSQSLKLSRESFAVKDAMVSIKLIGDQFRTETDDDLAMLLSWFADNLQIKSQAGTLIDEAIHFVDDSVANDRLQNAITICKKMEDFASRARLKKELNRVQNRWRLLISQSEQWQKYRDGLEVLSKNPNDIQANLDVGLWRCFTQDEWKSGVQNLLKTDDETLQTLAQLESSHIDLADQPDPTQQAIVIGDAWWDASIDAQERELDYKTRAGFWYELAKKSIDDGDPAVALISRRLNSINGLVARKETSSDSGKKLNPNPKTIKLVESKLQIPASDGTYRYARFFRGATRLVVADENEIITYDLPSTKPISTIRFDPETLIQSFSLADDGKHIAFISQNAINVVNVESGKTEHQFEQPRLVSATTFSNSGHVVSGTQNGALISCKIGEDEKPGVLRLGRKSNFIPVTLNWHPRIKSTILVGALTTFKNKQADKSVQVHTLNTVDIKNSQSPQVQVLATLPANATIDKIHFSANEDTFAVCTNSPKVSCFNLSKKSSKFVTAPSGKILNVAFLHGSLFAGVTSDSLFVWHLGTGKLIHKLDFDAPILRPNVASSSDGSYLILSSSSSELKLFQLEYE